MSTRLDYDIQYADLDANGHVNNVALMRVFQEVRARHYRMIKELAGPTLRLVIANVSCSFHKQLFWPGRLECTFGVDLLGRASFQGAFVARDAADGAVACQGRCVMSFVDASGRAVALDTLPHVVAELERLESRPIPRKVASL